jgi:hypothetical protein
MARKQGFWDWFGLGMGTFCNRTWRLEGNHVATLEHDCMIGRRIFNINGKELYNDTVFPDRSFEITFELDGKKGVVSVVNVHKELAIYYTMVYDGEEVVSTVFDDDAGKSLENAFDISVPEYKVEGDKTLYLVKISKRSGEESGTGNGDGERRVWKRFSEFVQLHHQVWSSFAGSHLLSNVPAPPSRAWKLFTNHFDPSFLESRREGVERFISKLMQVPRIGSNVYIHNFFEGDAAGADASADGKASFIASACDLAPINAAEAHFVGVAAPGKPPEVPEFMAGTSDARRVSLGGAAQGAEGRAPGGASPTGRGAASVPSPTGADTDEKSGDATPPAAPASTTKAPIGGDGSSEADWV